MARLVFIVNTLFLNWIKKRKDALYYTTDKGTGDVANVLQKRSSYIQVAHWPNDRAPSRFYNFPPAAVTGRPVRRRAGTRCRGRISRSAAADPLPRHHPPAVMLYMYGNAASHNTRVYITHTRSPSPGRVITNPYNNILIYLYIIIFCHIHPVGSWRTFAKITYLVSVHSPECTYIILLLYQLQLAGPCIGCLQNNVLPHLL